jgi:hypothetical protein
MGKGFDGKGACGKKGKQRTAQDFEFTLSEHHNGFWSRSETSSVLALSLLVVLLLLLCSSTRRAGSLCHFQDLVGVNHRAGSPRLCINAQTFVRAFRFLPVKLAASGSKLRFITVQFGASQSDSRAWF